MLESDLRPLSRTEQVLRTVGTCGGGLCCVAISLLDGFVAQSVIDALFCTAMAFGLCASIPTVRRLLLS